MYPEYSKNERFAGIYADCAITLMEKEAERQGNPYTPHSPSWKEWEKAAGR